MVYRDGKSGRLYAKKFKVGGVTREKEYPLFKTHSKSRIFFFAVHDNEMKNSRILVHLDPELKRVKEMVIEFDFAWLDIQGRGAKGSTLTSHKVDRVVNAPKENGEDEKNVSSDEPIAPEKTSSVIKETLPSKVEEEEKPAVSKSENTKEHSFPKTKDGKSQATFEF